MTQTKPTVTASLTGKWKPYPAYKDSGVEWLGEIPEHWEVKQLKYLARLSYGDSLPAETRAEGGIPVFGSNGPVGFHSEPNTLAPVLVIGRKGSFGKVNFSDQPCFAIDTTYYIDIRNSRADLRWLFYALLLLRLDSISEDSAIPGLSRELAEKQWLPATPFAEQRVIAAFLDRETARINALIAKKERLVVLLQEKRAALISHAVTKGLDPAVRMRDSGVEWLGEIPAHWDVKRLKFVTSFVTSGSRGWAQYYSDDGPIFLRIGNLSRTSIALDLEDIQHVTPPEGTEGERTRVKKYDVLISVTAYIGSVAVVSEDIGEAYVNQHIALTRPRHDVIDSKWLGYCLLSLVGQDQFHVLLYGGTKDGLGLDDVKNLLCLVPPIFDQHAIISYLDAETAKIDALISRIQEGIEKLKEYSSALISAAVTGKIDVREEIPSPGDRDL